LFQLRRKRRCSDGVNPHIAPAGLGLMGFPSDALHASTGIHLTRELPHYHRRCIVSLPSSTWDQVFPHCISTNFITRWLIWTRI
jgi:hypothetical protein